MACVCRQCDASQSCSEVLRRGAFTVAEAEAAGLSRRQLQGSAWQRICQGWYRWAGCELTDHVRFTPIARGLPEGFAFAGVAAARLHGLDIPLRGRPEVVLPVPANDAGRVEAVVRRVGLSSGEIVWRRGFPVTSALRTCLDLAARLPLVEAVVALDQALIARLIELPALEEYVCSHAGANGVVKARRAVALAEPRSESPMETRLRLLLQLAGLPRPSAQVELRTAAGRFVARVDLFCADPGIALEYDGENHRDRMVDDNRRQNGIQELGIQVLRYTGPDLRDRPEAVVAEVRAALRGQLGRE